MKKGFLVVLTIAVIAMAAVVYGMPLLSETIAMAAAQPAAAAAARNVPSVPNAAALSDLEGAYEGIYASVNPSVVTIQDVQGAAAASPFQGRGGSGSLQQQALGSGFVWDNQGDIVTNNHVVAGASQITVTFADGTTVSAQVVGTDPDSDLAVVKVNAPANELHPVQMGDSNQLKVGQLAIAIGNPFGEQNTMTTGIISAIGRSLPVSDNASTLAQGPTYTIPDVIQTDAPINPGNSGGVLLNTSGQVVGVTQSIESPSGTSAGIGFAIPSAIVQKVVPALIQSGHFVHPYIGISGTSLVPDLAQAMGLNANQRGALVIDVTQGSPADQAGLHGSTQPATVSGETVQVGGDVITAVDGHPLTTFDNLIAYLAQSTQVNQTIDLTILRGGQEQSVRVTLAARPSSQSSQ